MVRIIFLFYIATRILLYITVSRKLSHDRIHGISSARTMINALILTRSQIRPKLNGKLLDSRDNHRSRNNAELFRYSHCRNLAKGSLHLEFLTLSDNAIG